MALSPGAFFRQSPSGAFLWMSGQSSSVTSLAPSRWLDDDLDFWSCVHELDQEAVQAHFQHARESGGVEQLRYRLRLPDEGRILWVHERRRWIGRRGESPCFEGSWIDETAAANSELRLPDATWQRTLASLAPGVGHDLNNYFTSILTLSDGYVRKSQPDHPFHEGAKTIRDSVQQATKLVQQFVGHHVARPGERSYQDLNEVVSESLDFLRHTSSRRISFLTELHPTELPIYADRVLLRRIIFTLVKNAIEAIPSSDSGKIRFSTAPVDSFPSSLRRPDHIRPGRYVRLSVSDSGGGVPTKLSRQIFLPWTSSKSPAEGLGWSLAAAHEVCADHQGAMSFEPGLEGGSIFHIWLPLLDLNKADASQASRPRPLALLVGKEPALEETAENLRAHGFSVVATEQNALELLQTTAKPFQLVCLLPDADPNEAPRLARQIRLRRWTAPLVCDRDFPRSVPPATFKPDVTLGVPLVAPSGAAKLRELLQLPPFQ